MPRDLPVGNGNLLVNFDRDYNIRDIYYPYVGKANHSNGCISRTGVWVDGQFSWLSDPQWDKKMSYLPSTIATHVIASNAELGLRLEFNDVVDFHRDIFLRRVEVLNQTHHSRNVRLFFHYDFLLWEVGRGDAIDYHPGDKCLIAYKDNCYFLINASVGDKVGVSSWSTGRKNGDGEGGSWSDAEDGVLDRNPNSFGSIDGVISVDRPQLGPRQSAACYTWLAAAQDRQGVRFLDYIVRQRLPQYYAARTINYWRAWVRKDNVDFRDLPRQVARLYERSLLIIRTQVDNRGGIIAANDSDLTVLAHGRETYSYVWPRDGAYIANALDAAGYGYRAAGFYDFCKDVIHYERERGDYQTYQVQAFMLHKYTPDKMIASSWMPQTDESGVFRPPIEEDETALIPYGLWQHYERFRDVEMMKPWFRPLIVHIGNFMVSFREENTRLPAPSYDLWEERRGIYCYTVATVWAGLVAAAKFARLFGELDDVRRFNQAAKEIKEACEVHLYDEKEGRFLKKVSVNPDGSFTPDYTVDASLYGLWYFGMFEPDDPRIERTMNAVAERLWCQTEVGGLARYEGDEYHWDPALNEQRERIPGNPWIITTLWLTQYHIAKARTLAELRTAIPLLEWVCDRALPSGVLAEQVHPLTGEPVGVSPLTWSHATVVTTVQEYIKKYEVLQRDSLIA